jgi:hypothetical protein
VDVLSAVKVSALFHAIMLPIMVVLITFLSLLLQVVFGGRIFSFNPIGFLVQPILSPIFGAIGGAFVGVLCAPIYNLVASLVGGLELELKKTRL